MPNPTSKQHNLPAKSDSELKIEKAQRQLKDLARLARQIEETVSSADAEEEKLKRLGEDGAKITGIKERLKHFFGA